MSLARISAILGAIFIVLSWWIIVTPITNFLPEATNHASDIDFLFKFMLVASIAVFLIVQGFLLYFALRYRRRKDDAPDALGADIHGNTRLEIVWSVIPAIFLVVLTALSYNVYEQIIATHKGAYVINAVARQFSWECDHPAYKIAEFNTCHMPVDTEITVNLKAMDVIHSFWVPEFRVKQDAVPGYPTQMHFKTTHVGNNYRLICTEFCGVAHSEMYAKLYVMPKAQFVAWAKGQQQGQSGTLAGLSYSKDIATIFQAHCSACHIQQQFGGLNLGNYQGLIKGGIIVPGPVIKPHDHLHSYLWEIIKPAPPYPGGNRMPLGGGYLQQHEIDKIAAWIDQGAKNN